MEENFSNSELIQLSIQRLSEEIDTVASERLDQLLKESDDNQKAFDDLKKIWEGSGIAAGMTQDEVSEEWFRLKKEMKATKSSSFSMLKIAASIALIISVTLAVIFLQKSDQEELAASNIASTTLNDGSKVTLNANSRLTYPSQFEDVNREVNLSGEAFFEIEKDPEKPFIIHTDAIDVTVLGTSFNVRSLDNESTASVTVATGIVRVNSNGNSIQLVQGEKGILDKQSGKLFKVVNDDKNYLSWKTKTFQFDNLPLSDVINILNNAYQSSIELKNSDIVNCPVTVGFEKQSLNSILEVLKATLDLEIEKNDNVILLTGNGC